MLSKPHSVRGVWSQNKDIAYLSNSHGRELNFQKARGLDRPVESHSCTLCESLTNHRCYLLTQTRPGTELAFLTSETCSIHTNSSPGIKTPSMMLPVNPNTDAVCPYLLSCLSVCVCFVNLVATKVQFCVLDSGTPASWMCVGISLSVCQCLCACVCVCVRARNGCAAAVSLWAVYGSHTIPSSCSSVSHMSVRAAVIGWKRSRRGRRAGMDGQREGPAVGGGEGRSGVGRKRMSM